MNMSEYYKSQRITRALEEYIESKSEELDVYMTIMWALDNTVDIDDQSEEEIIRVAKATVDLALDQPKEEYPHCWKGYRFYDEASGKHIWEES
jgi:hypothetical protein